MRTPTTALILTAFAITAVGCSSPGGIGDLERPAEPSDTLPGHIDMGTTTPDAESVRLAAKHDGNQLWLLRAQAGDTCLVVDSGPDSWAAGCSGQTPFSVSNGSAQYVVVGDNDDAPSGATAVSDNIYTYS